MDELVECNEFRERPSLEGKDFVDYFNLEFGIYPPDEFEKSEDKPFYEHDFKFIGFFLSKEGAAADVLYCRCQAKPFCNRGSPYQWTGDAFHD